MSSPEIEQQTSQGEPQGILLTGEGALALDEKQRELLRQVASQMAGGLSVEAALAYEDQQLTTAPESPHLLIKDDFVSCYKLIRSISVHYNPRDIWERVRRTYDDGIDRAAYPDAPLLYLPKDDGMGLDVRSVKHRLVVSNYAHDAWFDEDDGTVPFLRLLTDMHLPRDAKESPQT